MNLAVLRAPEESLIALVKRQQPFLDQDDPAPTGVARTPTPVAPMSNVVRVPVCPAAYSVDDDAFLREFLLKHM